MFLFGLINAFKKFSALTISGLKLLSSRHRIFVSFSEHTGSILQSSEQLFMSSQSRGYLTVQTELDTRWIIFCRYVVVLWFVFGKNETTFGDLIKLSCGGLGMYASLEILHNATPLFSQTFRGRKITLWLLTKRKNKCTSLFFRNALLNFIPFQNIYGKYLRNFYFYYIT